MDLSCRAVTSRRRLSRSEGMSFALPKQPTVSSVRRMSSSRMDVAESAKSFSICRECAASSSAWLLNALTSCCKRSLPGWPLPTESGIFWTCSATRSSTPLTSLRSSSNRSCRKTICCKDTVPTVGAASPAPAGPAAACPSAATASRISRCNSSRCSASVRSNSFSICLECAASSSVWPSNALTSRCRLSFPGWAVPASSASAGAAGARPSAAAASRISRCSSSRCSASDRSSSSRTPWTQALSSSANLLSRLSLFPLFPSLSLSTWGLFWQCDPASSWCCLGACTSACTSSGPPRASAASF
mmetsp:Transcript_62717/g.194175  ORF Transcript_62717/g.194175 Transcript_62717/m.194175 type:complete len:302 (+) Transcript_62717:741-1646(+)